MLTSSCTCLSRGSSGSFWGGVEIDDTSVVPVCDDYSPSSKSNQIERNVHFSKFSTINIVHKSSSSHSSATTSTRSTFSAYEHELENDFLNTSSTMPTKIKTFHTTSSEDIDAVNTESFSNNEMPSVTTFAHQRQQLQWRSRNSQRHRVLGHKKRKQRVRKLLAKDLSNRQRKSVTNFDQD